MRREQRLADLADLRQDRLMIVSELVEEDAARQRVAVRVQTRGRQADQDVAFAHVLAGRATFFSSTTPTMKPAMS